MERAISSSTARADLTSLEGSRGAIDGLANAYGLGTRHPFRWTQAQRTELPVHTQGELPAWLKGKLVRSAPAVFERGDFHAQHWFDGLGLLYSFELGQGVHFRQQLVESRALRDADASRSQVATFGTDTKRSFWRRLLKPIPAVTDNVNVNAVPWQGKWLAMTETQHQHVIDGATLRTQGLASYQDKLSRDMATSAHPHYDAKRASLVNVGVLMGPKNELVVFRQHKDGNQRVVEGRLPVKEVPYIHAFGLTDNYAVLIDHPLRVKPWKMLFSNRAFASHFSWQGQHGTRLWRLDRRTGAWTLFETDALFCFHIVNTFEQGDDVVFDFLAFEDAAVVQQLSVPTLLDQQPPFAPRLVRARLSPGQRNVKLEQLTETHFEFPQINYRSHHAQPYRFAWGARLDAQHSGWVSQVVKVDVKSGETQRYADERYTYGEPVFVPRPGAHEEDDGVLLAVGSHVADEQSRLAVLDARTLAPLATCDAALCLPMGFHGNFQLA